jgi:transcriptional regulator with XRE-family HTH domain
VSVAAAGDPQVSDPAARRPATAGGPVVHPGPGDGPDVVIEPIAPVGAVLRARREQLGWSQARLARASRVSRTVVNEIEHGKRAPTLRTYERLRAALGHEVSPAVALIPAAPPPEATEQFRATLAAALLATRRPALADLATALDTTVPAVRAGLVALAGALAAVGMAAVDDGVHADLILLPFTRPAVDALTRPEDAPVALSPEAVTVLVIVGYLGEPPAARSTTAAAPTPPTCSTASPPWGCSPSAPTPPDRGARTPTGSPPAPSDCSGTPPPSPSTPGAPNRSTLRAPPPKPGRAALSRAAGRIIQPRSAM